MAQKVEIELSATGAAAVAKVFDDVAKKGAEFATRLATGSKQIESSLGGTAKGLQDISGLMGQAGINTGILGQALGALSSPLGVAAAGFVALSLGIKADDRLHDAELRAVTPASGRVRPRGG